MTNRAVIKVKKKHERHCRNYFESAITLSGIAALTLSGIAAVTLSGIAAITLSGIAAVTLSGIAAIALSGIAAFTLSGIAAAAPFAAALPQRSGVNYKKFRIKDAYKA